LLHPANLGPDRIDNNPASGDFATQQREPPFPARLFSLLLCATRRSLSAPRVSPRDAAAGRTSCRGDAIARGDGAVPRIRRRAVPHIRRRAVPRIRWRAVPRISSADWKLEIVDIY
jgi:hypothetical protein